MQLMWLSGPTGHVRTLSITARTMFRAAGVVTLVLVLLGFVLNWVGLRFAVEYSPELARSMGGVTTEAQHQRMESDYRARLDELRDQLHRTAQELQQLESLKSRLVHLATPQIMRDKSPSAPAGRGGPLLSPKFGLPFFRVPLHQAMGQTALDLEQLDRAVKDSYQDWQTRLDWLERLPNGLPVAGAFHVSSGFGLRNDPFTGSLALHEGIDFSADPGTPVLAAAEGTVVRSGYDATYGNVIEIQHADGFLTRYGHLQRRHVLPNQPVQRGELIGNVGNTGRSTGPHLHLEIFRHGRAVDPLLVMNYLKP
jgi:murein DD-endopeptidase MepM/ murein hydrolase activator NlpD